MNPAAAKLRAWRKDMALFVRECLGAEPDSWQLEACKAASAGLLRLALKACKGPGKSAFLAWLVWWFLCTRLHPKVVCTSITGDNLRDGLWAELAKWQQHSEFLRKAFTWKAERIVYNGAPETWWASARTWAKGADASQQANTLAGIHANAVLFVLDEAGGIPDGVAAAAEAGLANADATKGTEAMLAIAGNPTDLSGPLYRACTKEARLWKVITITGDPDSPKRSPRVSVEWARQQIEKYGRESPYVIVNVFGEFPPTQSNALLGPEDVARAMRRTIGEAEFRDAPKVLGVDVARFGDDRTIIQPRQGWLAMRPRELRNLDTMETADQVALAIAKFEPDAVFVDSVGVGAGVADRLRQLGHPIIDVSNGSRSGAPQFVNKRTETWWAMADWVRKGGVLPEDQDYVTECTAPEYWFDSAGKVVLEPKAQLKERIGVSPDKADALAMTFAHPVVQRTRGRSVRESESYTPFTRYAHERERETWQPFRNRGA